MTFLDSLVQKEYKKYTLDEILTSLVLLKTGHHYKKLAEFLNRKPCSVYQKLLEKQTTINGITQCRSILKHKYEDASVLGSAVVNDQTFYQRLYAEFNEAFPENLNEDISKRVEGWLKEKNNGKK